MLILPSDLSRGDLDGVPLRQARNYTRAIRRPGDVLWVVIHTAECAEVLNAAENLAAWAAGPQAPRASWHFAIDANSITQSVLERDVAWHAPGANARGIGVEHAGRARQGELEWGDLYSAAMLQRSASLVAGICHRWGVPALRLYPSQLLAGESGICGHVDVSAAFKKSTHWDPGPKFPWDDYLDEVSRRLLHLTPVPATPRSG